MKAPAWGITPAYVSCLATRDISAAVKLAEEESQARYVAARDFRAIGAENLALACEVAACEMKCAGRNLVTASCAGAIVPGVSEAAR